MKSPGHAKKLRRKDPCHCGSGRKYKRCHLTADKAASLSIHSPAEPLPQGGLLTGRPFIDAEHQGYRFRAVGGRLYYGPLDESFHEFVLRLLREQLTHEWIRDQLAKQSDHQHLIVRWFLEKDDLFSSGVEEHGGGVRSIEMTGGVKSLLSLGYDAYSLLHTGKILPKLVNRLKHPDQFQGARYEMSVAAIAARCGLKIEWLNTHDKHCEFIARDEATRLKIGFEAKSHHRPGVLHQSGEQQPLDEMRVKLGDHLGSALKQAPSDTPFVVFNDLNLPLEIATSDWQAKVDESLEKSGVLKQTDLLSIIFVTNFAWHFATGGPPPDSSVGLIETSNPRNPLPRAIVNRLAIACSQYGIVPAKLEEFQSADPRNHPRT